jgi:Ca2+-binding RTX toxin-like protein
VWRGAQAYGPNIDLRGGRLAPGATAEADGTPEIEVEIKGAPQIGFFVIGSRGGDSVELGTFPDGTIGVNLNAATESAADADITMPPDGIFGAELLAGHDRLDASGGSLLPGSPAQVELFIRSMGANADEIVGGAQESAMVGGDGRDRIVGGAGPDRIGAGPGDDFVAVRGGGPDSVQCGADFDTYEADRDDDLRLCERRAHPGA